MEKIKKFVKERMGKDLAAYNSDFLRKTIKKRMIALGIEYEENYSVYLASNKDELSQLLASLTVIYSDFFREPYAFYALKKQILSDIAGRKKSSREIRIWSVGCSIGQEPYSIAMAANEFIQTNDIDNKIRIFASDNAEAVLNRGRLGRYSRSELKHVTLDQLDNFFIKQGDQYEVISKIREQVTFLNYDILDPNTKYPAESIFGNFDLIFCRNLMIYYKPAYQKIILGKLNNSLMAGGYLVAGEAEGANVEMWTSLQSLGMTGTVFQSR